MLRNVLLLFVLSLTTMAGVIVPSHGARAATVRTVEGSLTYRTRDALPQDAGSVVEVHGADGALIAEAHEPTGGRQVPIPFSVQIPADTATAILRASLVVQGQPRWVSEPITIPPGSGTTKLGEIVLSRFMPVGNEHTLQCGEKTVGVAYLGERAILDIEGLQIDLMPVPVASGERYQSIEDPSTVVLVKDGKTIIDFHGKELPECVAAEPAAPFRARGNEPGWNLDITDGRLVLVTGYGEHRQEAPLPAATIVDGATIYDVPQLPAKIRITEVLCHDLATGMPFPRSVTVTTGSETLSGCGGEPLDLLLGPEWIAEDIDGGIVDGSRATMTFSRDGQISGSASCNRYHASYSLTGEGLTFSDAASTMMACDQALMLQERRFLDALEVVALFDFDATGALILQAPDGSTLIRARRG